LISPKRGGKGTIARIIRALIGIANVAGPTLATLALPFGLWPLLDKSVAIIPDARLSSRSDKAIVTERLLAVSGEDCLVVDRKHLPPVNVKLPTRIIILSNEVPRLADASGTIASRMIVLRMTKSWYGCEDTTLTNKLITELPGILLWAIGGWARLRRRGHFIQPHSAADVVGQMQDLASPVAAFAKERCLLGPELKVARSELYQAFVEWCQENGRVTPPDTAGFGRDLRAAFPTVGDSQPRIEGDKVRLYLGICLKTES
jgi:putative DNA primase/helicase